MDARSGTRSGRETAGVAKQQRPQPGRQEKRNPASSVTSGSPGSTTDAPDPSLNALGGDGRAALARPNTEAGGGPYRRVLWGG